LIFSFFTKLKKNLILKQEKIPLISENQYEADGENSVFTHNSTLEKCKTIKIITPAVSANCYD